MSETPVLCQVPWYSTSTALAAVTLAAETKSPKNGRKRLQMLNSVCMATEQSWRKWKKSFRGSEGVVQLCPPSGETAKIL